MSDKNTTIQIELNGIIEGRNKLISSIDIELNSIVDRINNQITKPDDMDRYNELVSIRKIDIKKARDAWNDVFNTAVFSVTGLKIGDRVEYVRQTIFLSVVHLIGTVVKYRGQIQIRLDEKHSNRRYADIHTGWHIVKEAI